MSYTRSLVQSRTMRTALLPCSHLCASRPIFERLGLLRGIVPSVMRRTLSTSSRSGQDRQPLTSSSPSGLQQPHTHFRASGITHPLGAKPETARFSDERMGDHSGGLQNHIWTEKEIEDVRKNLYKHKPTTFMDKVMNRTMFGLYHMFNKITGYQAVDPSPKAIEWRLIVLESVAGVPGFVAAGVRHFRSLRTLKRDHGWILTLLEEAENERMHLLVCMTMFNASWVTRSLVVSAQCLMTPVLFGIYLVQPKAMHRFVGYLEETAVHTYDNIITHVETPGTKLHAAWADLPASDLSKGYWRLPKDARWVDTLKCMMADEAHHRDINHTFATLPSDDPNPFLDQHKQDASRAWMLENEGKDCWDSKEKAI